MCTIHSKVVEDHQKELQPGAVLVLRQVGEIISLSVRGVAKWETIALLNMLLQMWTQSPCGNANIFCTTTIIILCLHPLALLGDNEYYFGLLCVCRFLCSVQVPESITSTSPPATLFEYTPPTHKRRLYKHLWYVHQLQWSICKAAASLNTATYSIARKFGRELNLAVWRSILQPPN